MRCTRRTRTDATTLVLAAALAGSAVAISTLTSCVVDSRLGAIDDDPDGAVMDAAEVTLDGTSPVPTDAPIDAARPPAPVVSCTSGAPCALAIRAPVGLPSNVVLTEGFCVLLASGKVACWGDNRDEGLGLALAGAVAAPTLVDGVSDAIDLDRGCAILSGDRAACWGRFVAPSENAPEGGAEAPGARLLALPPAKKLRMSRDTACALLTNDQVSCWGRSRESGQLGYVEDSPSPVGIYGPKSAPLPSGDPLIDLAVGTGATFALRTNGAASSWGTGFALGRVSSLSPDPYPTNIEIAGVSALSVAGTAACAIANDDVHCWGHGSAVPKAIGIVDPVRIATAGPMPFGRGCAIDRKGDVWCWGKNDVGQAGTGTMELAALPVKVQGLPKAAVAVEVTGQTSCAILVDGHVSCWGGGAMGQLGRATPTEVSPVPLEVLLPEAP